MKVLILSTSHRPESSSLRSSLYIHSIFQKKGYTCSLIDFVNDDIPLIGKGELNYNHLTDFQKDLIQKWEEAQIIIVVTPEYNWGLNANVTNLFHQLGGDTFKHLFDNKIFGIVGVSSGRGGKFPAVDLMILISKLINFLNQYSIVSPKILELHEVPKNLNEKGELLHHGIFEKSVKDFIEYIENLVTKWKF
ncbi:MAG: hypothetical protein KatS3mg035_1462 [Bacteroidia bacterium]|nr:MAG: hypothetical protein KatS3mg035_1462 [Bacteroidia bacterium]